MYHVRVLCCFHRIWSLKNTSVYFYRLTALIFSKDRAVKTKCILETQISFYTDKVNKSNSLLLGQSNQNRLVSCMLKTSENLLSYDIKRCLRPDFTRM